jgi:hypothetical protein
VLVILEEPLLVDAVEPVLKLLMVAFSALSGLLHFNYLRITVI